MMKKRSERGGNSSPNQNKEKIMFDPNNARKKAA